MLMVPVAVVEHELELSVMVSVTVEIPALAYVTPEGF